MQWILYTCIGFHVILLMDLTAVKSDFDCRCTLYVLSTQPLYCNKFVCLTGNISAENPDKKTDIGWIQNPGS